MTKQKINAYKPENDLEGEVLCIIKEDIADYDNPEDYFSDLFQHGCQSGMIGELIYNVDTAKFTKNHLEDIMDLVEYWEEQTGEPMKMDTPKTNWLAWFGFEETARKIYQAVGGEDY